jgi:ABC-type transport system substrate-binding protein
MEMASGGVRIYGVSKTSGPRSLQETRVVDDHTVVCKLKEPTLVFLNNVSQTEWGYAGIPHARHVAQHGKDYGVVPASICGTGPFRVKEWIKDDRIELTRFDEYRLAIFFTVMGFNCLGDGLRDALDPRLRAKAAE